jgi:hypothetical protein
MIEFDISSFRRLARFAGRVRDGRGAPPNRDPLVMIEGDPGRLLEISYAHLVYVDVKTHQIVGTEADDFDMSKAFDPRRHVPCIALVPE